MASAGETLAALADGRCTASATVEIVATMARLSATTAVVAAVPPRPGYGPTQVPVAFKISTTTTIITTIRQPTPWQP